MVSTEQLVVRVKDGDQLAAYVLIQRFGGFATHLAHTYFIPGGEFEDLRQEALGGLVKAIRDYDADTGVPFDPFASLCMQRNVITAIKAATRAKHGPLNDSLRGGVDDDGEEFDVVELVPAPDTDPLDRILGLEQVALTTRVVWTQMSRLERQVTLGLLNDESYEDVAARLGVDLKTIDNAIQRARVKVADAFEDAA